MTRSGGSARRSGDPRKRVAQASAPDTPKRTRVVVAALLGGAGLVAAAGFVLWPADQQSEEAARGHAEAACDLTSKADEAAGADTAARYAAATLLMDRAILESARAAEANSEFADLDRAVQAVHTAAHQGSPGPWRDTVDDALAVCSEYLP